MMPAKGTIAASIDIGSNTVRVLVVRFDGCNRIVRLCDEGAFARLGEGVSETARLSESNVVAALNLIRRYAIKARELSANAVFPFATAAVREAENGPEFMAQVAAAAGVQPRVIDGEEEAALSFAGVAFSQPSAMPMVVMDIGGRSTELAWGQGAECREKLSCSTGSRRLKDLVPTGDEPIASSDVRRMTELAAAELAPAVHRLLAPANAAVVGVGGTITSLAAIDLGLAEYAPTKVQGHRLSLSTIDCILAELSGLSLKQRREVISLSADRADVIVPGAVIVSVALRALGADQLGVDVNGVRLGAILAWITS